MENNISNNNDNNNKKNQQPNQIYNYTKNMDTDLKRGEILRKTFRMPSRLKCTPLPLTNSETDGCANFTSEIISMAKKCQATGSIADKSFHYIQNKPETVSNRLLKLSDILKPSTNEVDDKNTSHDIDCNDINNTNSNNNDFIYANTKVIIGANDNNGDYVSDKTSIDVLKDLEKRLSRMEQTQLLKTNEKLYHINDKMTMDSNRNGIKKLKNQYAERENLTKAGIESSTESSFGPFNESDIDSNENIYFVRGLNSRSSITCVDTPKSKLSHESNKNDNNIGNSILPIKPVVRALSDTKAAENSVHKIRMNYMQKKLCQDQIRTNPNHTKIDCSVNDTNHTVSPISPLSHKKKEHNFSIDKQTNKPHTTLKRRDALRHPITHIQTVRQTKRDYQVIGHPFVFKQMNHGKKKKKKESKNLFMSFDYLYFHNVQVQK